MTRLSSSEGLQLDLEDSCREAFCTSLLLTGSALHAESVVMEAIELWNPNDTVEGAFTRYVIDRSVRTREEDEVWPAAHLLREELRPVLHLPQRHRHCFVLRVLVNLSGQACARILNLTSLQVDRYTAAALSDLVPLNEQERPH